MTVSGMMKVLNKTPFSCLLFYFAIPSLDYIFEGWDGNVPACLDGMSQKFIERREGEDKSQATENWSKGAVQGKGLVRAASAGLAHWPTFQASSPVENPPSTPGP